MFTFNILINVSVISQNYLIHLYTFNNTFYTFLLNINFNSMK